LLWWRERHREWREPWMLGLYALTCALTLVVSPHLPLLYPFTMLTFGLLLVFLRTDLLEARWRRIAIGLLLPTLSVGCLRLVVTVRRLGVEGGGVVPGWLDPYAIVLYGHRVMTVLCVVLLVDALLVIRPREGILRTRSAF